MRGNKVHLNLPFFAVFNVGRVRDQREKPRQMIVISAPIDNALFLWSVRQIERVIG